MREEKRLNNLVALSQSLLLSLSRIATRRGPYTRSPRTTHDAIGPPHRHPLDESVCVWRTLAFRCSLYGTALLARAVKAHAARARARRFHMFNNSASAHGKRTRILPCACLPDAPSCARLSSSALWSPRTHTLCPRGSRLGGDLAEGPAPVPVPVPVAASRSALCLGGLRLARCPLHDPVEGFHIQLVHVHLSAGDRATVRGVAPRRARPRRGLHVASGLGGGHGEPHGQWTCRARTSTSLSPHC